MPPRCHTLLVTSSPVAASVPIFAKFLPCEGRHCDDELITQGRGARQLLGLNNEDWIQDISLHFLAVCRESLGHPREASIATIATMHTCSHHQQQCRLSGTVPLNQGMREKKTLAAKSMCRKTYFDIDRLIFIRNHPIS